ncbi:hypothetical protein [Clostridium sartagoforme]|uniref:hypothetical protein n=1 Tax=Clostridium sartagoforme TaxID=84031 RepID=UPI0031DA3CCE
MRFKGLSYTSEKAIKEQWFIKPKARSIDIVYDPRNINKIYISYDNGLGHDECYLMENSLQYKNCILEEIIFNQELLSELKEKKLQEQNQMNIDLDKEIEKIVKEAKKEKQQSIGYEYSKSKKLKGIKNNRAVEKEVNRVVETFDLGVVNIESKIVLISIL